MRDITINFKSLSKLEIRAHDLDIKRFIQGQMHRLPRCMQQDNGLQMMVQEKLSEAVDGMLAHVTSDPLENNGH